MKYEVKSKCLLEGRVPHMFELYGDRFPSMNSVNKLVTYEARTLVLCKQFDIMPIVY